MSTQSPYPMIDAASISLPMTATLMQALACIERSDAKIALIQTSTGALAGTVTDGDIRRGLLKGETLESPVSSVMNRAPYTLSATTPRKEIMETMRVREIRQVPLVDSQGCVVGLVTLDQLSGLAHPRRNNAVVIMAGGKGLRLLPLTSHCPKPMVEINGKPILEWMLQRFVAQGFHRFYIAINYLGHMIEEHFGDGEAWGCSITYIREEAFLGTAGALSLIEEPLSDPVLVINGDILASIDFADVVEYHMASKAMATVCARQHSMEVPYGVIQLKDGMLQTIVEKPVHEDLISAGIYVLNPGVLATIPRHTVTDMPSVLVSLAQASEKVAVFPMREEWVDVGRHSDLELAKRSLSEG